MRKKWLWLIVTLVVLGLDYGSKTWVLKTLVLYHPYALVPGLNLTLAFNSGSAFGFLSDTGLWHQWFLTGFSIAISIGLVVWMAGLAAEASCQLLGLSLILSGALGNVFDRLQYGYVIDFIDLYFESYHWPVFNLADSAICVGAVMVFFSKNEALRVVR